MSCRLLRMLLQVCQIDPLAVRAPGTPAFIRSLQTQTYYLTEKIISYIMASESIVKDTFYKSRLLQSGLHAIADAGQAEKSLKGLSKSDIQKGLQNFQKTAIGQNYAFVTFKCNHQAIQSIDELATYVYLSSLDVSNNNIRSLKVLSHLRYLVSLKASNNQLTQLLDLKYLPFSLENVDCSANLIETIPNLGGHQYLRVLNLQKNKISKIEGLKSNKNLQVLDVSQNLIQNIQGLDDLNLTELYLSGNKITRLKGLSKLQKLRILDLSNNQIVKLRELVSLISLRNLYLSKNKIKHARQIQYIEGLPCLQQLDLCYNPIQQRRYYRSQVLYRLSMLNVLDGTPVTSVEVVKAENLYGSDVPARAEIFREILPEEQFVDRRIHISQLIEIETDSEGQNLGFVDQYDEQNNRVLSASSKSKEKSLRGSKTSGLSKLSKFSKESSIKP